MVVCGDLECGSIMNSYYEVLAAIRARSKLDNVMWSQPYKSYPDIWGQVVSAVTPVYDKTREPWLFLGVASTDHPLCDLLDHVPSSSSLSQASGPANTVQGCTCAESFMYEGLQFDGCTTYDWAKGWCGTTAECGVCDDQVTRWKNLGFRV